MNEQTGDAHPDGRLRSPDVEGFDSLAELALDLRWSWNHAADRIWGRLDPVLWELTHNPWVVLQTVSRETQECSGRSRFPPARRSGAGEAGCAEAPRGFRKPTRKLR